MKKLKLKKLTKTEKAELKRKAIKGLNIMSYIVSALSILIFTIVVVNSCSNKKVKNTRVTTEQTPNALVQRKENVRTLNGNSTSWKDVNEYDKYFNGFTYVLNPTTFDPNHGVQTYTSIIQSDKDHPLLDVTICNSNDEITGTLTGVYKIELVSGHGVSTLTNPNSYWGGYIVPQFRFYYGNTSQTIQIGRTIEDATALPSLINYYWTFRQIPASYFYGSETDIITYQGISFASLNQMLNDLGYSRQRGKIRSYLDINSITGNESISVSYEHNYYFNSVITMMSVFPGLSQGNSALGPIDYSQLEALMVGNYTSPYLSQVLLDADFSCRGASYRYIVAVYMPVTIDSTNIYIVPYGLYYYRSYTDTSPLLVAYNMALDYSTGDNGSPQRVIDANSLYSTQWTNSLYSTIFINNYNQYQYNATMLNLQNRNVIDVLDVITSDSLSPVAPENTDIGSVFGLLGGAFSSIASLFAIQILPGVTFGILLFIPFVVMVVIFIVWLFKR